MKLQYNDKDVTDNAGKNKAANDPEDLYLSWNVCAIAADDSSTFTVWFVQITVRQSSNH